MPSGATAQSSAAKLVVTDYEGSEGTPRIASGLSCARALLKLRRAGMDVVATTIPPGQRDVEQVAAELPFAKPTIIYTLHALATPKRVAILACGVLDPRRDEPSSVDPEP
ncbi:MAG TPA: hypothetical protein VIS07_08810 [Candidatus Binatia bacterium]